MGSNLAIHVIVRDCRVENDPATMSPRGGQILWEYDRAEGLPYVRGDTINSPTGTAFMVLECQPTFCEGRSTWAVAVTDAR